MKIGNLRVRLVNICNKWKNDLDILIHHSCYTSLMLMKDINYEKDKKDLPIEKREVIFLKYLDNLK